MQLGTSDFTRHNIREALEICKHFRYYYFFLLLAIKAAKRTPKSAIDFSDKKKVFHKCYKC